jgi:hypothetical protein
MIRPSYWTDADLQVRLTAEVREFYIGLWMQADDGGVIAWDLDRVGADLYPYRSLAWRRKRLPEWVELLKVNGHVVVHECGKHIAVPSLPKHQAPPKPSYQHRNAHAGCLLQVAPLGATGDQRAPAQEGGSRKEGKGRESEGGARARDGQRNGASEFDIAMAVAGNEIALAKVPA